MKKLNYMQGAMILTTTNLITGILAFAYRIYLSWKIGDEGMGVFQLVLPLYTLLITLVSGGVTTAVSKLIAQQYTSNKLRNIYKIIRICCLTIGGWSLLLCILISSNANFISTYILKDIRTTYSVIVFTPAVFFISLSAILRGYFFGLQNVMPPAIIDIAEKLIRLVALVLITYFLLPYGIAHVCAGAMIAMTIGEFISFILLFTAYKVKKTPANKETPVESTFLIVKKVVSNAIPLSISGALTTIMDMICAVIVPSRLRAIGYSNSMALALFGQLTGMATPLLFFPFIVVFSIAITLVPAVTESFTSRNWKSLNKKCNDSLRIISIIGFAATALFLVFPMEICDIFFKSPQTGKLLFWMALGCVFEYWQFELFAILSGLGLQRKVLENSILNIIITLLCAYMLTSIPSIGIYGYIIGFNISAVLVTFKNLYDLKRIPQIRINYLHTFVKPFICFTGLLTVFRYGKLALGSSINVISILIVTMIGILIYIFLLSIKMPKISKK